MPPDPAGNKLWAILAKGVCPATMRPTVARSRKTKEISPRTQRVGADSTMPTVTVEGEKSFEVAEGTKLVLAIEDAGIDILHKCGGNARCTTCRVQVIAGEPGPMEDLERTRLEREGSLGPDIRLSCQIRVNADLTVNVLGRASAAGIDAGPRPAD